MSPRNRHNRTKFACGYEMRIWRIWLKNACGYEMRIWRIWLKNACGYENQTMRIWLKTLCGYESADMADMKLPSAQPAARNPQHAATMLRNTQHATQKRNTCEVPRAVSELETKLLENLATQIQKNNSARKLSVTEFDKNTMGPRGNRRPQWFSIRKH